MRMFSRIEKRSVVSNEFLIEVPRGFLDKFSDKKSLTRSTERDAVILGSI